MSPQIAADTARRLRRSIADLEHQRATLAELGLALDAYHDLTNDCVLAFSILLTKLRREAARCEFWAQDRRAA